MTRFQFQSDRLDHWEGTVIKVISVMELLTEV